MPNFCWPKTVEAIHSHSSSLCHLKQSRIDEQVSKLEALSSIKHTISPVAKKASELGALRSELNALLFNAFSIAISPYQYGIGNERTLTPVNACKFAAQKLRDQMDSITGNNALAFWVGTDSEAQLAESLTSMTRVLPFHQWIEVASMARQYTYSQYEHGQIPVPAMFPYWVVDDFALADPINQSVSAVLREVCQVEASNSENDNALSKLKRLGEKAQSNLAEMNSEVELIKELFQGACDVVSLSGTINEMANQLEQQQLAYHPHAALMLIVSDDEMVFLHEMVGL